MEIASEAPGLETIGHRILISHSTGSLLGHGQVRLISEERLEGDLHLIGGIEM